MIDLRIYRAALLPALLAVIVVMFSIEPRPDARVAQVPPDNFDAGHAAALARAVLRAGVVRTPGSAADLAAADLVREQLGAIQGGQVSEQSFPGSFKGQGVQLKNIVLLLPGDSDRRVVLIAHRDSARGPGLTSSAAATGALVEIADAFGGLRHHKTLVFVSTDGGSTGGSGARHFADDFPGKDLTDAAIVLDSPGVARPRRPFISPWSADDRSTSVELERSADRAVRDQVQKRSGVGGVFAHLVRLAFPSGLGEAAVLIADRVDAIQISAAGDRPPPPTADGRGSLSTDSLDLFGRATLSLLLALDENAAPLKHGPSAYLTAGGNLIPGWSLALLAVALLLPVGITSIDGLARAARRKEPVALHALWVLGRALPFLALLVGIYAIALVGWIPAPGWPFDPGRFGAGFAAISAAVALTGVFAGAVLVLRPWRLPPTIAADGLASAIGAVLFLAGLGIWLANPYLALVLAPTVHLWALSTLPAVRRRIGLAVLFLCGGLLLPAIAIASVAGQLGVGVQIPWQVVLMISGHHIGLATAFLTCIGTGCLLAALALVRGLRGLDAQLMPPPLPAKEKPGIQGES